MVWLKFSVNVSVSIAFVCKFVKPEAVAAVIALERNFYLIYAQGKVLQVDSILNLEVRLVEFERNLLFIYDQSAYFTCVVEEQALVG